MAAKQPAGIPVLTDVLSTDPTEPVLAVETLIAELQTRLAASAYELTDEIIRTALAELEGRLYRQISSRLRRELPELIDSLLREHLGRDGGPYESS